MLHALIPVKPLATAKTRLAGVLSPSERCDLMLAMLADVLAVVRATPLVARVTVISRDGAALSLAGEYGAHALPDTTADLNAALAQGARALAAAGTTALLVLPADLPLVTPGDIDALVQALGSAPAAALAPSRDGGTNALLVSPPIALPFLFGRGSLAAHLAAAHELGIAARLVRSHTLALDVDIPDDLHALACAPGDTTAQRLVRGLAMTQHAACA